MEALPGQEGVWLLCRCDVTAGDYLNREWLYLLSHKMFNPYFGLFEYSAR